MQSSDIVRLFQPISGNGHTERHAGVLVPPLIRRGPGDHGAPDDEPVVFTVALFVAVADGDPPWLAD
jgi:hypothetical protein